MNAYSLTAGMQVEHSSGIKGRVVNTSTGQYDGDFKGKVDIDNGTKGGLSVTDSDDTWADDGWTVVGEDIDTPAEG